MLSLLIKKLAVASYTNQRINLSEIVSFPKLFLEYINKNSDLKPFYDEFPDINGFKNQIEKKQFTHREILVDALNKQYENIENPPENIKKLGEKNTFCVTTGHQLNIFTGPLYVIYKIVSTINLAKKLAEAFPNYNFVPVYWMATEDHDFAEINHFTVFGQEYTWLTEQKGAVGRMNPNELENIINNLKESPNIFKHAYLYQNNLADAVRLYMHQLFGNQGLVSISGDDKNLKTLFKDVISADILSNKTENIVQKTSTELENLGYKTQISARKVNFFYLDNNFRERIDLENEKYVVQNSNLAFDSKSIAEEIAVNPEKFSPNVVLRPLYQETILPNLAYIGGPSEVAYWLQLKDMFENYNISFPIVMPRNFALIIAQANKKRKEKLGLNAAELFQDDFNLKRNFVEKNSENNLSLAEENERIAAVFEEIILKIAQIDPTLRAAGEGEKTKVLAGIGNLEKRVKKAEERNFETAISQVISLKEKLFPNGNLQERTDNFLNFYLNNSEFIDELLKNFDPLNFEFNILEEN